MGLFRSEANDNLTELDKRFFELRKSGYDGPIDHNGMPLEDPDEWIKDHS